MPIGKPAAGADIYLLNDAMNRVPLGDIGEIYIGGMGLARGYLNRPELTTERFVERTGERLYRTGDLGRWGTDGRLQYLGRCDRQVKLHGIRIELGEIEAAIATHPHVQDCVVTTVATYHNADSATAESTPLSSASTQLAAYYVACEDSDDADADNIDSATLPITELRQAVHQRLPNSVCPAYFVPLDRLPLTANGKVDLAALPVPTQTHHSAVEFEPPQTEAEAALAQIWQQVLRVEQVGRHDDFFELGGDSIMAIQIAARYGDAGWSISPNQLFQHSQLADLATVAKLSSDADSKATDENVTDTAGTDPFALANLSDGQMDKLTALLNKADGAGG